MSFTLPRKFPLLPRKKNTDKSHYGHALLIAGSRGMMGAAILSARAALASGSGLVTLGLPSNLSWVASKALPEAMSLSLPGSPTGHLGPASFSKIGKFIKNRKTSAVLIGPGLSQNGEVSRLVRKLVKAIKVPVILDADGINSFKGKSKELLYHSSSMVVTPHKKEFERLFSARWPERQTDRIRLAKKLSKFYDVVLVMKGHRTLVVSGDRYYVNRTGNPGMAKGGSGDVLSGIITAFISQGLEPFLASCWAVYFHGKAADLAVKERGELGLLASDIIQFLPKAFRR